MRGKIASFSFLAVCVVLAALLVTQTITPTAGSLLFAIALGLFGIFRGLGRRNA